MHGKAVIECTQNYSWAYEIVSKGEEKADLSKVFPLEWWWLNKTGNNCQKPMVLKIHTWNICTRNVVTHFYTSAVSKMRANTSGFGV